MPRKNTGTQKIASSSMDATTQHPDYVVRIPEWQRVRDCMKGEQAIKNAAMNTIGTEEGKYPSSEWKSSGIKSRVERGEDYELR